MLFSLGFYSGPTDGNITSERSKTAIRHFQKVYGLTEDEKMNNTTKKKLNSAYTMKSKIMSSSALIDIDKKLDKYTMDYTQRDTFANTWTFLRVGMGLTKRQTAGVCANIMAESVFSADNAQDSSYLGVHNRNYKYNENDGIGYGLIQWYEASRKKGLNNMAKSMKLSVSNVNVQLAYFRKEMTTDSTYKEAWKEICNKKMAKDVSDIFLDKIERAGKKNRKERRNYASIIYHKMKNF